MDQPYIGQRSPMYKELKERVICCLAPGRFACGSGISGSRGWRFMTSQSEARQWYADKLKASWRWGRCFKTDFGERIPPTSVV